jgi:hypothetical protein
MRLNPPTVVIFLISLVLAALAIITKMGFIPIPRYLPHQEYWLAMTAYLTLMIGLVFRFRHLPPLDAGSSANV